MVRLKPDTTNRSRPGLERLRQAALDVWNGLEQRPEKATAGPSFEPCGVIEHESMRQRRWRDAANLVESCRAREEAEPAP